VSFTDYDSRILAAIEAQTTALAGIAAAGTAQAPTATATLSALASKATSDTALAANTARKGVIMVNTDANDCRVKFGATASASSFSVIVPGGGGQWQMESPIYTGVIDAIWDADGSGSLFITEL
jgi:hypothetical protein